MTPSLKAGIRDGSLFMEFLNPKFPFFSMLTKFQQCMLQKIYWILISPDSPTKIPNNRQQYVQVHCTLIEYEMKKPN